MNHRLLLLIALAGLPTTAKADDTVTTFNFDTLVVGGRNLSYIVVPDNSLSIHGPGAFPGTSSDLWGPVIESINDDVLDDSLADPFDRFGVLIEDFDGMAFAAEDLLNPDNPSGTASATWTFNISGFSGIRVSINAAAMGNFETINCGAPPCLPDEYTFTASIDGGPPQVVFAAVADETLTQTYILESGVAVVLDDPLRIGAVVLSNQFQTVTSPILGSGSVLTLHLSGQGDSGEEVFIFDDIVITVIAAPNCYANCDQSATIPVLTANDFLCFLNRYAANDPLANCDQSVGQPVLSANDFVCFLNAYAAGCS